MFKIIIKTSTRLPAAQVAEVSRRLSHVFEQTVLASGTYEIVYDADAPTLETYGQVGRAVIPPSTIICKLYADGLGSLSEGFAASDVAYAAHLTCLNAGAGDLLDSRPLLANGIGAA